MNRRFTALAGGIDCAGAGETFRILQAACRGGQITLDFDLPYGLTGAPMPADIETGCEVAAP